MAKNLCAQFKRSPTQPLTPGSNFSADVLFEATDVKAQPTFLWAFVVVRFQTRGGKTRGERRGNVERNHGGSGETSEAGVVGDRAHGRLVNATRARDACSTTPG